MGKTTHKKRGIVVVGAIMVSCLALAASAFASAGESNANIAGIPPSQFQINPKTCKFLHREIDPATPKAAASLSSAVVAVNALRIYSLYEDRRHDIKLACVARRLRSMKGGPGGPGGNGALAGYVQVRASGTGRTVTATCPTGDVVLGGGSPDETTGSYPSSKTAWTVVRDHLSPKTLTVIATCAKAAS